MLFTTTQLRPRSQGLLCHPFRNQKFLTSLLSLLKFNQMWKLYQVLKVLIMKSIDVKMM